MEQIYGMIAVAVLTGISLVAAFIKGANAGKDKAENKQGQKELDRANEVIDQIQEAKKSNEEIDNALDAELIAELRKSAND